MIQTPSVIDYDAGSYIVLQPGFVANQGSIFSAYIQGCGGTSPAQLKPGQSLSENELISKSITDPETGIEFSIYPNPSDGYFTLNFVAVRDEKATIRIYNSEMNLVSVLADNKALEKGSYTRQIDLSRFASGLYFCRLEINNKIFTRRIQILH